MEIIYTGQKERKRNGHWRCYFVIKKADREYTQDFHIDGPEEPTNQKITDTITLIEESLIAEDAQIVELRKPKYYFREVYQDLTRLKEFLESKGFTSNRVYNRTIALLQDLDNLRENN